MQLLSPNPMKYRSRLSAGGASSPAVRFRSRNRGFALIVTLSLMILLTVIAVGLLSLSTISLRVSSQSSAMAMAQANARMSLMLAVGELQLNAGPDTRVTARADIVRATNPMILGAWKSWEGTDHDPVTGLPKAPDYTQKKTGRFLNWLVSGDPAKLNLIDNIPPTDASASRVPLVGNNTLAATADPKLQINLDPVYITNSSGASTGAYAWWVGGENQKARLPQPDAPSIVAKRSTADWASAMKSNTMANPKTFGMESLMTDATFVSKAVSLKQSDFITQTGAVRASRANFYDLSTVSTGLLTNTATGGWRKDLSLFTEKYGDLPTSNLQLFRLTPNLDSSQGRVIILDPEKPAPTTSPDALVAGSLLYPWSGYRSGTLPYEKSGAVASWANLANYALMYRKFQNGTAFSMISAPFTSLGDPYKYLHTVKPMPIVARVQWVYSYSRTDTNNSPPQYRITIKLNPVVTLWNPYNVELKVGKLVFTLSQQSTMPLSMNYQVMFSDGTMQGTPDGVYRSLTGNGALRLSPGIPEFFVPGVGAIPAGGTKVFSVGAANANELISYSLEAGVGFTPGKGHFIQLLNTSGIQIYTPTVKGGSIVAVKVKTKVKLDNLINADPLRDQIGIKLVVREDGGGETGKRIDGTDANEMIYQMLLPKTSADSTEISLPDLSVQEIINNGYSYPFMSLVFGLRMIDNLNDPSDSHSKNKLAKSFVQTSPTAAYSDMAISPTTNNRINAAYDYNLLVHAATDDVVPNVSGATGYLFTGLTAATGISRCIAAELPVKPLASLGELQGWDMRFGNPAPPFAYNVIGNSDATPLIASNAVIFGSASPTNLQHDDSYCANHVLFDDWFFSSINEGISNQFGTGGSLKTTYKGFITGSAPLVNSSYEPISEDTAASSQADALYSQNIDPADSWRKIASHLEVKGMFNVNSTSVTAWKALLGHARGQQVPRYGANGIVLDSKTDFPVIKYSVAGDVRADSNSSGTGGNGRSNTSQYTGYRVFTDKLIDDLANKIVDQVRKRGPFLSLSEFVNRQVSLDKNLAVAGAIQTALNQMELDINGKIDAPKASVAFIGSGYQFPEATTGSSALGMPGWVRQADILRPLAPILSVRDDTFVIRAYGDARDPGDKSKILATATCEVTVRRTRNYCDPKDAADFADILTSSTNKTFGRKFDIVSFRWLSKSEI